MRAIQAGVAAEDHCGRLFSPAIVILAVASVATQAADLNDAGPRYPLAGGHKARPYVIPAPDELSGEGRPP